MSRVFFISDPHFGHKNLQDLRGKPSEEIDDLIITNWNKTVSKRDTVYLLGDITMEKPKLIQYYLSQLSGDIRVVGGNHDLKNTSLVLQEMGIPIMGCLEYKGFICTHIPIHPSELHGYYRGNIHGHIHNLSIDLGSEYFNVTCEHINYIPIEFTTILKIHADRKIKDYIKTIPLE